MRPTRLLATAALAASLALVAACGGAIGGAGVDGRDPGGMPMSPAGTHDGMDGMAGGASGACRAVEEGAVALAAEALAYDAACIEADAGVAFTIAFENRDGAPHNVTIEDPSGATVVDGENVTQGSIEYAVPALDAGDYPFHCHVHPDMRGVVRVG